MPRGKQVWVTLKPQAYELLNAFVYAKNLKRTAVLRRIIYEFLNTDVVKDALVTNSQISRNHTVFKAKGIYKRSSISGIKKGSNAKNRRNKRPNH